ncbi:hypothetical protein HHX47_DHR9000522 [Lentinula edodes]|nr:hypothetical protein HHX47_DHR9000522 [Lentinula edodes]
MADVDGFYRKIRLRLVESGEWERMKATISPKLNESGWLDDIKHKGVGLPLPARRELQAMIRDYLERQFE